MARETATPIPAEVESWYVTTLDDGGRIAVSRLFGDEPSAREWWAQEVHLRALLAALDQRDFGRIERDLVHPDFAQADHRAVASAAPVGIEGFIGTLRRLAEQTPSREDAFEVLDVAGADRVAHLHFSGEATGEGGGPWEIDMFTHSRLRDGRMIFSDLYASPEDARAAMLAAQRAQPAPPPASSDEWSAHVASLAAFEAAINADDETAIRAQLTEDFRQADHRVVGTTEIDIDGFVAMLATSRGLVDDMRVRFEVVAVHGPRRVGHSRYFGHGPGGGGDAMLEFWTLGTMRDGRLARSEIFDSEEAALAALRARDIELPPLAHATVEGWLDAINHRDMERLADFVAPDHLTVDRRNGVSSDNVVGRDRMVEAWTSVFDVLEGSTIVWEPLAVRAEWLYAFRLRFDVRAAAAEPAEVVIDHLVVQGRDGRTVRRELFAPEDREALLARLGELEREGPPPPLADRVMDRLDAAWKAGDWDAIEALYTPGTELIDHRPVSPAVTQSGAVGSNGFREILSSVAAMGVEVRLTQESIALCGGRLRLARGGFVGLDAGGGEWELAMLMISEHDENGLISRSELFGIDAGEAARSRFDELASDHAFSAGPLTEAGPALRGVEAWTRAHNARDFAAFSERFTAGYRLEDHRPLVRHALDREAALESWSRGFRTVADLHLDCRALAAAGRALIARYRWTGRAGGYEIEMLAANLFDDAGRVLVTHSFEVDDPAAWEKYRELARGGAAGSVTGSADRQAHEAQGAALDAPPGSPADARARLGTPFGSLDAVGDRARHERICVDYDAAVHAQDWERLTALLHADLRHRDHRLAGGPELDRAGFVETNRQGSALVQQLRSTTRVLAVEGDQNVFMQVIVAETLDGGQMEIEWFAHLVLREDKIWRVDMYDSEAQARESLAGASADGPDEEAAADLGEHQRRR